MHTSDIIFIVLLYMVIDIPLIKLLGVCGGMGKDFSLQNATSKDDFFWRLLFWVIPFSWIIFFAAAAWRQIISGIRFFNNLPPK